MKKRLLTTLVLIFVVLYSALSQSFQWAKSSGGHVDDSTIGLASDSEGNAYLCGDLNSGTSIGDFNFDSWGAYLAKFDSNGEVPWAISFGSFNTYGVDIALDSEGNIYFAGIYSSGFTYQGVTLSGGTQSRIFLMKLDAEGSMIWLKGFGTISTTGRAFVNAIDIDHDDNVYLGGNFQNPIQLGDSVYTVRGRPSFDSDMLLVKLSPEGNVLSVKNPGSTSEEYIYDIKIGASGIYATGFLSGSTIEFEDFTFDGSHNEMAYIMKYSFDGNLEWVKSVNSKRFSEATTIAVNDQEEVIVAGRWIEDNEYNTRKTFISKFSPTGEILKTTFINSNQSGNSGPGVFARKQLDVVANGQDFYFTSSLSGSLNIGPLNFYSSNNEEAAVVKFNEVLYPQWISVARGLGTDKGLRVASSNSSVFMSGDYSSSQLNFGSSITTTNNSGNNDNDFFLSKIIDSTPNSCPENESFLVDYASGFCEGDSIMLSIDNSYAIYTKWLLNNNSLEHDNDMQIYISQEGIYELQINTDTRCPVTPIKIKVDKEANKDDETDIVIYPQPEVQITSPEDICDGEMLKLSASLNANYEYSWILPQSLSAEDTASNELEVMISSYQNELKFYLEVRNKITGCYSSDSILVKINQNPVLNLQSSGRELTVYSQNADQFTWFLEGVEIEEFKNLEQVEVYESGNYYVQATNSYGCMTTSDSIYMDETVVGNDKARPQFQLEVFPNPTQGKINFTANVQIDKIELINLSGEIMLIDPNIGEINIEHLTQGVYILNFHTKKGLKTTKIIKE